MAQLLSGGAAVLVGGAEGGAQAEVDDLKALFHQGTEKFHVLADADGGGFGQDLPLPVGAEQVVGGDVYAVGVLPVLQNDMVGVVVELIALFQVLPKVAGAVGGQKNIFHKILLRMAAESRDFLTIIALFAKKS